MLRRARFDRRCGCVSSPPPLPLEGASRAAVGRIAAATNRSWWRAERKGTSMNRNRKPRKSLTSNAQHLAPGFGSALKTLRPATECPCAAQIAEKNEVGSPGRIRTYSLSVDSRMLSGLEIETSATENATVSNPRVLYDLHSCGAAPSTNRRFRRYS